MKVVRGRQRIAAELGRPLRAPTVAIGNFDGVHRRHQALVQTAADLARVAGGEAVGLTFHAHPAHPFALTGEVVPGAGRGRGLGIPTANLRPDGELLPRTGIYAGRDRLLDGSVERAAAVSVGTNPTFVPGAREITVEAHLLDFDGDL